MPNPFDDAAIDAQVQQNPLVQQQAPPFQDPTKPRGLGKGIIGAMLGGDLADAISTNVGNTHGEVNPLLPKPGIANFAGIMGTGVAKALLLNKLAHSHPTLARALAGGSIGLSGYDTTNNVMNDHGKALWPFNSMKAKQ